MAEKITTRLRDIASGMNAPVNQATLREAADKIESIEAALAWTWDNSKLLESAIPVPSSILKTYRSLGHSQSDRGTAE